VQEIRQVGSRSKVRDQTQACCATPPDLAGCPDSPSFIAGSCGLIETITVRRLLGAGQRLKEMPVTPTAIDFAAPA
jgi:hypothetical protein